MNLVMQYIHFMFSDMIKLIVNYFALKISKWPPFLKQHGRHNAIISLFFKQFGHAVHKFTSPSSNFALEISKWPPKSLPKPRKCHIFLVFTWPCNT